MHQWSNSRLSEYVACEERSGWDMDMFLIFPEIEMLRMFHFGNALLVPLEGTTLSLQPQLYYQLRFFFHFSDLFCWVTEAQLMYLPSSSFTLGRLKLSCMFSWYKLNMCACFHVIGAGRHHSNYRFSTNSLGLQDGRPLWQTTATEVKGSIALLLGIFFFLPSLVLCQNRLI